MGSVVFTPVKNENVLCQIELSNILHVPLLGNNLLSVLTLTRKHNFKVHIQNSTMSFSLNNEPLFEATVREDNSSILNAAPVTQTALSSSLLSPDLWHPPFAHIGRHILYQLLSEPSLPTLHLQ